MNVVALHAHSLDRLLDPALKAAEAAVRDLLRYDGWASLDAQEAAALRHIEPAVARLTASADLAASLTCTLISLAVRRASPIGEW